MLQEIKDIFPTINKITIFKFLLSLREREKKYGKVGVSRLEATKLGTTERKLRKLIDYLRGIKAINKIGKKRTGEGHYCNVYKISEWFKKGLQEIKTFCKKNVRTFVLSNYEYKEKKDRYIINNGEYIIMKKGRFKDKIYNVHENRLGL